MTHEQREAFDASAGLVEVRALPDDPTIPAELRGVTPPAWWTQASDGGSWAAR